MTTPFRYIGEVFLNDKLDLRVRLFNILAIGGTIISSLMALLRTINGSDALTVVINLVTAVLSFTLLTVSRRTGRYQFCYMVTIVVIFMCFFPILFIKGGGYHGGFPHFFVFAVLFTIFMLEGKKAIVFSAIELALYAAVCIYAYFHIDTIGSYETDLELLLKVCRMLKSL